MGPCAWMVGRAGVVECGGMCGWGFLFGWEGGWIGGGAGYCWLQWSWVGIFGGVARLICQVGLGEDSFWVGWVRSRECCVGIEWEFMKETLIQGYI